MSGILAADSRACSGDGPGRVVADPELIVTNFNRRFTGVSATLEALLPHLATRYRLWVAGWPPRNGFPAHSRLAAIAASRRAPADRPFRIWHVRRNSEMATALFVRDVLRRPLRIVFTSAAIRRHSRVPRGLIARMDAVIATSEAAAGLVPHVAAVIPHGVDLSRFTPPRDRSADWAASGLPGRFGIGIVGRVRPEKGTDLFVEAMVSLLPRYPDWTAVIIGGARPADAAFSRGLAARIADAGLAKRVVFLGEVPPTAMPDWYRRLSLVVAAGRYEGYGMTVLEAMASGAAVVATRTGAYEKMVAEGSSGRIVPPDDRSALISALEPMLAAPAQTFAMGQAGSIRAEAFGTVEEATRIAEIYERLWRGETF